MKCNFGWNFALNPAGELTAFSGSLAGFEEEISRGGRGGNRKENTGKIEEGRWKGEMKGTELERE